MDRLFSTALLLAALIGVAGCSDDAPTTPTSPTPTPTTTDTFTGVVNRNGAATHSFTVNQPGQVTATLTGVGQNGAPDTELVVGFALGTWSIGGQCTVVLSNDTAKQSTVIYGQANSTGTLCVRFYDVGNIVRETSYEISVVHP